MEVGAAFFLLVEPRLSTLEVLRASPSDPRILSSSHLLSEGLYWQARAPHCGGGGVSRAFRHPWAEAAGWGGLPWTHTCLRAAVVGVQAAFSSALTLGVLENTGCGSNGSQALPRVGCRRGWHVGS